MRPELEYRGAVARALRDQTTGLNTSVEIERVFGATGDD
jgi:hypothetical protein